jgi:hypothetical protein
MTSVPDSEVAHEAPGEVITRYTTELDTDAATDVDSWTRASTDDAHYSGSGQHPTYCSRKTKLSGHPQMEWQSSDYRSRGTTTTDRASARAAGEEIPDASAEGDEDKKGGCGCTIPKRSQSPWTLTALLADLLWYARATRQLQTESEG